MFKDSLRIFDVSLKDLCKNFNVEGKLHNYDHDYNKPSLFRNNDKLKIFIKYGLQDSESLLKALKTRILLLLCYYPPIGAEHFHPCRCYYCPWFKQRGLYQPSSALGHCIGRQRAN